MHSIPTQTMKQIMEKGELENYVGSATTVALQSQETSKPFR